jgi:2-methylisocitrate lyase-like PEP mutase family enzyme
MDRREQAEALRAAHADPELLVLVNVWDAASARAAAAAPGCRGLATASWSIAAAHGVPDGEALSRDAMLAAVGRIAAAVTVPVSADLERGYGATPAEAGETVAGALAAGAVGCNLEDGTSDPAVPLSDAGEHAERVAAARAAGTAAGVPVVINARTDVFLAGAGEPAARPAVARERGLAYLAAGADCVFVPGLADRAVIATLGEAFQGRLSLLATPATPPLGELAALGVARVTFGPGTLGVALAALTRAAEALLAHGAYPDDLTYRPPTTRTPPRSRPG